MSISSEEKKFQKSGPYSDFVTDLFITAINKGEAPWQKEINKDGKTLLKDLPPFNPISGAKYLGFNHINLKTIQNLMGSDDPRWATSKQCEEHSFSVRPEEVKAKRGATITYYDVSKGEYSYNTVFNGSQIEGFPKVDPYFEIKQNKLPELDYYKAKDNSPREMLIQEISRYMAASRTEKEYQPNTEMNNSLTVSFLRSAPKTEIFYICNAAHKGVREMSIEPKKDIERNVNHSMPL